MLWLVLMAVLSKVTYEPRGLQSRCSRTPAGCQLGQSHLRSHKSNHVLPVRFFLSGPGSRDGFDHTVDSQGENCPFHPWMSLTSLCSNTSTGTAGIYACPFLLLISHTESSLFQIECLQIMLFLKEFCVLCYSDQSSTSWYWDGITFQYHWFPLWLIYFLNLHTLFRIGVYGFHYTAKEIDRTKRMAVHGLLSIEHRNITLFHSIHVNQCWLLVTLGWINHQLNFPWCFDTMSSSF